jgi:putative inorganic carbon (HCO3(-)) transporter
VLLAAPALLFPSSARLLLLLPVLATWMAYARVGQRIVPPTPVNLALSVLLAMVAVSVAVTPDFAYSLGKICGVILGLVVFWTSTRHVSTESRLRIATIAFLAAGGMLAALGLLGTNWFNKFPILGAVINRLPRAIRGVPGAEEGFHPNAVAGCLILFIPLQIALLGSGEYSWLAGAGRTRRRGLLVALLLLLGLTAGTLALTQSRGAWAGLGLALLIMLAAYTRYTKAAVLAIAIVGASLFTILGPSRAVNMAISQSGPGMAGNVSGRLELWSRGLYAVEDFPLTGVGMNMFRRIVHRQYPTFLTSPDFDVAHVHNQFLQTALDVGIPGLIAYVAIWLILAALLLSVYRRATLRSSRIVAAGLGLGLVAHFCFGLTDAIPLGAKVGILFWLTLALAVALHRVALAREAQSENPAATASSRNILTVSSE